MATMQQRALVARRLRELRASRRPRPWSQDRLVYELRRASLLREDLPVAATASLKVYVSRWENGHAYPDVRYRELLRIVFHATDEQLGFTAEPREGIIVEDVEPVAFQADWFTAFNQTAREWSQFMHRRQFLKKSAYLAAAATGPALQWILGDPEPIIRESGTVLVGSAHVDTIREMTRTFRILDNRFGGGHAREAAVRYLSADVANLILNGSYSSSVGRALLGATAEMAQLVGWMSYDAGDQGLGQRQMTQALRFAQAADDQALGAEILAGLSHQASYLHDGPTAVDLARAARKTAQARGLDALVAEAAVMEAHGHACAGNELACAQALSTAELALDRADRSADPQWIGYFDEAYLSAKFGHCFRELRQPKQGIGFARRSLDMNNAYVRGRAFNLALLATGHAQAGEVEEACAVGDEAIGLVLQLSSARANQYIRALRQELVPYESSPTAAVFIRGVDQALPQAV